MNNNNENKESKKQENNSLERKRKDLLEEKNHLEEELKNANTVMPKQNKWNSRKNKGDRWWVVGGSCGNVRG